jgi:hypothetical protein
VQKAIKSAFQGAIVVNTLLDEQQRNDQALEFYNSMVLREVSKNTQWTKQFYNRQNCFTKGFFWQLRKDVLVKSDDDKVTSKISLSKWDVLILNPKAEINTIPVLGDKLIETAEAVVLNNDQEPFVFLHNKSVVDLVKQLNNKPLIDVLLIIKSFIPDTEPLNVLKWLLYNRVLCKS